MNGTQMMRVEPPLDHAALLLVLRDTYGVSVETLTFLPLGFDGACYRVHCAETTPYILKCWPGLRVGSPATARLLATLTVTHMLQSQALVPRVSSPLPTRNGALWADLAAMPLALFPLLPGQAPPFPLPHGLREELARTIATIHRATPAVMASAPADDAFAIPDARTVLGYLRAVEQVHAGSRPGLQAMQRLVLPRAAEVLAQYARLQMLHDVVQQRAAPPVLCHRDLTGNNLLVDDAGRLGVLDWDAAALAPPEHDLWVVVDTDPGAAFAAYWRSGGVRDLSVNQFAFYLLRRFLSDMLARLARLVQTDAAEHEDAELVRGMEAYGFARWATLDATLQELDVVLR